TRPARPTQHTPCRMSVAQLCQGRMLGDAPAPGPASRPSTACQSLRLAQNASPSAHDVAMFWTIASLPDDHGRAEGGRRVRRHPRSNERVGAPAYLVRSFAAGASRAGDVGNCNVAFLCYDGRLRDAGGKTCWSGCVQMARNVERATARSSSFMNTNWCLAG